MVMFWLTSILVSIVLFAIMSSVVQFDYGPFLLVFIGISILVGIAFGFLFGYEVAPNPSEYETQYKVTISDEVNFNEFQEHYEIIDRDGKIYIVRERK